MNANLLSLLRLGGSIGGIVTGVRTEVLLGGIKFDVVDRIAIAGLPADVERKEDACSTKFRSN